MYKADGGERVWRKSNEKYHKDCIASTLKFGGGSVIFWGCFSWLGIGPLIRVENTLNTKDYSDSQNWNNVGDFFIKNVISF